MRKLTRSEREALGQPNPVDITTTGRRSDQPRRIEIWAHLIEHRIFITSSPGKRGWYANMLAQPDFVLHVKHGTVSDIPATARPIVDGDERRATFDRILNQSVFRSQMTIPVVQRIEGSCLVEVTLQESWPDSPMSHEVVPASWVMYKQDPFPPPAAVLGTVYSYGWAWYEASRSETISFRNTQCPGSYRSESAYPLSGTPVPSSELSQPEQSYAATTIALGSYLAEVPAYMYNDALPTWCPGPTGTTQEVVTP